MIKLKLKCNVCDSIRKNIQKIRNEANKALDDSRVCLTKRGLSLSNWSLRVYYSKKRILKFILLGIILLGLVFILYTHYDKVAGYLLIRNINSQGNLNEFFPSLFTAIGASILGVLAITFSLSLFAIQQAADKHTPTVLISFLKDRTNIFIFWSIALISLIFFVFAILPLNKFILLEVILAFVFLFLIFVLLRKQYAHITILVNPIHQVIFHHDEAIKSLNKIDKWLDLMIRIRAIQPGPANSGNMKNENT